MRVFNVCVGRVCVSACGGWCVLVAVVVLVGVAGRKVYPAEPVSMSRALDHVLLRRSFGGRPCCTTRRHR